MNPATALELEEGLQQDTSSLILLYVGEHTKGKRNSNCCRTVLCE